MRVSVFILFSIIILDLSFALAQEPMRPFIDRYNSGNDIENEISDNLNINFNFFGSPNSNFSELSSFFGSVTDNYGTFFQTSIQKENLTNLLGVGIGTTALMTFDQYSWQGTRNFYKRSKPADSTADLGEFMGNGKFSIILSGAFAAYGFIGNDSRVLNTGKNIFESLLVSGLLVQVLKRVSGKESPDSHTRDGGRFHFFPSLREYQRHQAHYYSFPSGHIASITSTLTVIINSFPEFKWIKPVSYGLMGIVGFGLVSKNMHWYSDLPLGVFLGYTIGNIISPENKIDLNSVLFHNKINVSPYISPNHSGISASIGF